MLPRLRLSLMTRHSISLPLSESRFFTGPNVDLGSRKESADADVDRKTAFDPFDNASADDGVFVERLFDLFPDLNFFGFFFGKHNVAIAIFGIFEQNIDEIPDFDRHLTGHIDELCDRNNAFRLVADIDNNIRIGDFQNRALHDFAFCEFPGAILV